MALLPDVSHSIQEFEKFMNYPKSKLSEDEIASAVGF